MALELPDYVIVAFNLIGLPWPGIDEDELRAWSRSVRQFADDVCDNSSQVNQTMRGLADSSQSSVIDAVAGEWERHHRLITEFREPAYAFADALNVAADAVVAQKWVIIGAAAALAAEFTATQIGAIFTLGADEAAVPAEVISTRAIVKFALEELAGVIVGKLINFAATEITDHLNRTISGMLTGALQVGMEVQSLKLTPKAVTDVSRKLTGQASEVEETGARSHAENSSRNIEDNSGHGGWSEVINALKQMLLEIAEGLFKNLPATISKVLGDIAEFLLKFAEKVKAADDDGDPAVTAGGARARAPETGATPGAGPRDETGSPGADGNRPALADGKPGTDKPPGKCTGNGDPVDVATGDVMLAETDVTLPGVLPLVLERTHRSSRRTGRWFGRSWMSSLDQRLLIADGRVYAGFADGEILAWPSPGNPGDPPVIPATGPVWPLRRAPDGAYTVSDPQRGLTWRFEPRAGYGNPDGGGSELPLVSVTDRIGHEIAFSYDAAGRPLAVTHSGGYRVLVTVADEHITGLTLAGRDGEADIPLRQFTYDTNGNLSGVVNSSGLPMRFTYDAEGRLTSWTDRNGYSYRYTFDADGRCVRGDGPDGALSGTFEYEPGRTRWTSIDGAVTTYHITDSAEVAAITDPLGNTTRWEHDDRGRAATYIDPLGRITRYAYDDYGNLTSITRPDGTQTHAEYDHRSLPVSVTALGGVTWRQEYDERGNCIALVAPDDSITHYGYDDSGHLTRVVDAVGAITRVTTNMAGLLVEVVTPEGSRIQYGRDPFGRVAEVTDPNGAVASFARTNEGYLEERWFPDGESESWTYDGEGNPVSFLSAVGAVTSFEYGPFDRLTSITRPDGTRTEFTYDHQLRLTSVMHGGLAWRYGYDAAGRLTAETDYNGATATYSYDQAGQLVSRLNAVGQQVNCRHDALGNLIEWASDGVVTTFGYDAGGRLVSARNPDADLHIERDFLGRVIAETCNGRTVASEYDPQGRFTRQVTPSGAVTDWKYDRIGQPVAMAVGGHEIRFGYDMAGRETRRELPGGLALVHGWNRRGQLTLQTLSRTGSTRPEGPATAEILQRRAYSYRPDGLIDGIDDLLVGNRAIGLDQEGRVTTVTGQNWAEQYAYDQAGNVTAASSPVIPSAAAVSWLQTETQGEREVTGTLVNRAGRIRYRHDRQGRVIQRQRARLSRRPDTWHYEWDADDRLTSVTTPGGARWHYLYDPLGRRIAKQRVSPDGTISERTEFTWSGAVPVEQVTTVEETDWRQVISWNYAPGTFTPVTQAERTSTRSAPLGDIDERFYAIITDLIGTPAELTAQDGTLAGHQIQTLWGGTVWGSDGASTPLRFPGQYEDPETGFHYNNQRYYDPVTGSYLSPDPLGLSPAPNPHTYVPNPHAGFDPLGMYNGCYLTQTGPNAYRSPAGLDYGPDPSPNFASRVDHVLNHHTDIPNRPQHGVFSTTTDDGVFSDIDEAYQRAQQGQAVTVAQGTRTVHYVNMERPVGYVGGAPGVAAGNPSVNYIKLVLSGNNVVTAFPVSGIQSSHLG